MMDDLQKEIDSALKKNTDNKPGTSTDAKNFSPQDLDDIILTPEETAVKNPTKTIAETKSKEAGEEEVEKTFVIEPETKAPLPKIPRTIADLLRIEADQAKPKQKTELKVERPSFGSLDQVSFPKANTDTESSSVVAKLKENLKDISYSPKQESPVLRKVRTLKGDIEEAMVSGKASVISMAVAEENRKEELRRAAETKNVEEKPVANSKKKFFTPKVIIATITTGILITAGVFAIETSLHYAEAPTTLKPILAKTLIPTQFEVKISADNHNASYLRSSYAAERKRNNEALNSLGAVYFMTSDQTSNLIRPYSTAEFFAATEMRAPASLTRTLLPTYTLGIHRFPTNQGFLILKTDSYDSAYAGMLVWENTLEDDVGRLLRTPSDFDNASSTSSLSIKPFKDAVIKNNDVRGVFDDSGNPLFFYTFLKDRQTIVMATSPDTLGEIISALASRTVKK